MDIENLSFEEMLVRYGFSKIRKILISGGCWSTERSREVQALYLTLMQSEPDINPDQIVTVISKMLGISKPAVVVNLPYINGINRLETISKNAARCARYREKKKSR